MIEIQITTGPTQLQDANTINTFDGFDLVTMGSLRLFNIVVGCTNGLSATCIAADVIVNTEAWRYTLSNIGITEPLFAYLGGYSKNIIIGGTKSDQTVQTMISSTGTVAPVPDFQYSLTMDLVAVSSFRQNDDFAALLTKQDIVVLTKPMSACHTTCQTCVGGS